MLIELKLMANRAETSILLIAEPSGVIRELPGFLPLGQSGTEFREPREDEVIPLPPGGHLYFLPQRPPLARKRGKLIETEGFAVAAILPQGYTRTLLPAHRRPKEQEWLPYFGYTGCFLKNDQIYVAALATNADPKWDPKNFDPEKLSNKIEARIKKNPENRALKQISLCATDYRCYTAANVFFERWEGALPVSPSCNSVCRGCISKADDPGPPSPQERFNFVPTLDECLYIVRNHFSKAKEPIISFGQGCEGEPSLQVDLIENVIKTLRAEFPKGQFNINTNGSLPQNMERFYRAGLDSMRVSLNSAQESWYNRYYRPKHYSFQDVKETIRLGKEHGLFVSLNLLCFPGVTDSPQETEVFFRFLDQLNPDLIQLRNLNIDPWCYLEECIQEEVSGTGMNSWINLIKKEFPKIKIGNFTPYVKANTSALTA